MTKHSLNNDRISHPPSDLIIMRISFSLQSLILVTFAYSHTNVGIGMCVIAMIHFPSFRWLVFVFGDVYCTGSPYDVVQLKFLISKNTCLPPMSPGYPSCTTRNGQEFRGQKAREVQGRRRRLGHLSVSTRTKSACGLYSREKTKRRRRKKSFERDCYGRGK